MVNRLKGIRRYAGVMGGFLLVGALVAGLAAFGLLNAHSPPLEAQL